MKVYQAFLKNAFLEMLAYRLRYYTGIFTYLFSVSVHYFIWSAVFAGRGEGAVLNGFTLPQMVTYVAIGWISRSLYFSNTDYEIDELVRSGQISIYLLRPVDIQLMMLARAFGQSIFRFTMFALPISAVIFSLFPVSLPASVGAALLFTAAIFVAFLMLALINFLVGLLAFSFKSIQGVTRAKYLVVQLFSGLLLPFTFFPEWIRPALEFLPFQAMAYVPLSLYLGKIPGDEIFLVFFKLIAWLAVLAVLGRYALKRALRKLTLQGG